MGHVHPWRPRGVVAAATVLSLLATAFSVGAAAADETPPVTPTPSATQSSETPGTEQDRPTPDVTDGTPGGAEEPKQKAKAIRPAADDPETPRLTLIVSIANDGTPDWDADDAAGNDSGPSNGIVRVNDTVTYQVQYSVNNAVGENTTFRLTFPKGMELTTLPGFCTGPGSGIDPATAGTPTLPLSAASIDELNEQTLTCNVGSKDNVSESVSVTARVLNLAHQGQDLPIVAADITADGVEDPVAAPTLPSVKASARLKWDISKNGIALTENSGYMYGPNDLVCPWDTSLVCKRMNFPVLLGASPTGKGAMPAIGDISFVDDLSPRALFPGLTEAQYLAMEADPGKYGARIWGCSAAEVFHGQPGPKISGTSLNATNSVRNSGTCAVTTAGGSPLTNPGVPVRFTVSGADTSLLTYPSEVYAPVGQAIPSSIAYAISFPITMYVPVATVTDFGKQVGNTWTLPTSNRYTEMEIHGFESSDVQTSADQETWNDHRDFNLTVSLSGGFSKAFGGVPGAPGNMKPIEFNNTDGSLSEGPPGGATRRSGEITVAPTQVVVSQIYLVGSRPSLPADMSYVGCDSWDNTKLRLTAGNFGPSTAADIQRIPSGGKAVWLSGYNNAAPSGGYANDASQAPALTVQYSATVGGTAGASTCEDAQGPWYDDPAAVPGNDPALAAQGIYSAVSRVRFGVVLPPPVAATSLVANGVRASVLIALRTVDAGLPTGTILPNWASYKLALGKNLSLAEMLADNTIAWGKSSYEPSDHTGSLGDRLILANAQARIIKTVRRGDTGDFSTSVPPVTGGDLVQYRLAPSLTSGAQTPGVLTDVWIEDCLPASQTYADASLTPSLVLPASPADTKRPACAAGETYIRWVLPNQEVHEPIAPIIVSVEVSPTADDGVYTNTAVIWAERDESTLARRTAKAQVQLSNIAGVKLEKKALTPVVQVNRPGQVTNESNKWEVTLTNTLPAAGNAVSDPDIIDVLPVQGTGATNHHGTFGFVKATLLSGGDDVTILYTSASGVQQDPNHASNGTSGSTTWCTAPAGGDVVSGTGLCPASADEVTGLRIRQAGAYLSGSKISVEIEMLGVGNQAGDKYENRVFARAVGLDGPVGPIRRSETVVSSSLGDRVWWDLNRNGAQDQFHGSAEPGASGVSVALSGVDDLGNPVSATTTTDSAGKYTFSGLRASGADGYRVTFTKPTAASGFTTQFADGVDPALDSNAGADGVAPAVPLDVNASDPTIDAGLLSDGGMKITKLLSGAGVEPFGSDDTFEFDVVCTFGDEEVYRDTVTLEAAGADSVTSPEIGDLPALTECTITETGAGAADFVPDPVTVTVPWDAGTQTTGVVTASLTNYYSAGQLSVTKIVEGDPQRVGQVKDTTFGILVTCRIGEGDDLADVFSGVISLKGGETVKVTTATGDPLMLPLGTRCFGQETETGGATSVEIDHDSLDNAVSVTEGTPQTLQQLSLTATNTFLCTPEACPGGVRITKLLEGAGVKSFGSADRFDFGVVCTLDGEKVFDETVSLSADGATSITSDVIGPIPGGAECVVSEIGKGNADSIPDPVTITVPWDPEKRESGVVTASLTNYYSAGYVSVAKILEGDADRLAGVKDKPFRIRVTCRIGEGDSVADLFSGVVSVRGGEVVDVTGPTGSRVELPAGAQCFGTEVDDGGATESRVDHADAEHALVVQPGNPDELQRLVITATNVFLCDATTCSNGGLAETGANTSAALAGLMLVLVGLALTVAGVRRRTT